MPDRNLIPLHRWMYPLHWRWKALRRFFRRRFWWIFLLTASFFFLYVHSHKRNREQFDDFDDIPLHIDVQSAILSGSQRNCTHFSCFDVYNCNSLDNNLLSVFWMNSISFHLRGQELGLPRSSAFHATRKIVRESRFFTQRREDACVFIPAVDLLTANTSQLASASLALSASPGWNGGRNHLLFSLRPLAYLGGHLQTGAAMIASPGFLRENYRRGFDVAIPFPNLKNEAPKSDGKISRLSEVARPILLTIFASKNDLAAFELLKDSRKVLLVPLCLQSLQTPTSPCIDSTTPLNCSFSLFCAAVWPFTPVLLGELLSCGCIPIIPADSNYVLPFAEVLDWARSVLLLHFPLSKDTLTFLESIPSSKTEDLQKNGRFFWKEFFISWKKIVEKTLQIVNERIFSKTAASSDGKSPLFLSGMLPKSVFFTAVVLSFEREENLFELISLLGKCPSLAKVVVVWNNPNKLPPADNVWPQISQPLRVLQMKANVLSNRFVPYTDIETEAIFSLDDDILMLTPDEIEFGFQVWLEHPDRLVGFPSRMHFFNSSTDAWEYSSEWGSKQSMVLTGAAFFSKTYSQYYTYSMPKVIRDYVDKHVNCEDLAMNFLIANLTGAGPLKVGPRKKFRCPKCSNVEMISSDFFHLSERTQCVNFLVNIFGFMPLVTLQYRADPVLYKEDVTRQEMRYPDIGAL